MYQRQGLGTDMNETQKLSEKMRSIRTLHNHPPINIYLFHLVLHLQY